MNKLNLAVTITGATGLFILNAACQAGCTLVSRTVQTAGGIPTIFSISSSQSEGSKLGSEITVPNSSVGSYNCSGTRYALLRLNPNWSLSNIANVYKTSIPGIGVKVREASRFGNISSLTNTTQIWYSPGSDTVSNMKAKIVGIYVQFYLIGPITAGEYPAETFVEAWENNTNRTSDGANYVTLELPPITVKKLTCETPNVSVNLDKHLSSEFSGINSKSAAKAFNFEIKNCSSGMNSVNYTFAPATGITLKQAGTSNQYITLDGSSTATGVGIQVLYENDTLVPFDSKIKYTGYNKTTGGSYTIPMKARYIQTASTISGGTANSAVEFTMSYE